MPTLTYLRIMRKNQEHIFDGVLYLHHFGTGFQELVFSNHEKARAFAKFTGCEYKGPR